MCYSVFYIVKRWLFAC